MALSLKQHKFIDAYLGVTNGNATRAARNAGYAQPHSQGPRMLENVDVRTEIERRYREDCMAETEVLSRLAAQARGVGAYVKTTTYIDSEGEEQESGRVSVDMKRLIEDGLGHLVHEVKETKFGQNIVFYDAQAALVHVGRNLKLFTDKHEVGVTLDAVLNALPGELGEAVRRALADALRSG